MYFSSRVLIKTNKTRHETCAMQLVDKSQSVNDYRQCRCQM